MPFIKGYKQTEEHKRKIADAQRGVKRGPSSRKEMSIIEIKCKNCNNLFKKNKSNIKIFHSRECATKYRQNNDTSWHSVETIKKMKDNHKGSLGKHWKKTPEQLENSRLANLGSKNPSWKGGISQINHGLLASDEYRKFRLEILKRDGYRCIDCGIQGGRLEVDHIYPKAIFPRLLTTSENCITRCHDCHTKTSTYAGRINKLVQQVT